MMSRKTVRRIFIFILIFLPLQYIAVGILGYYHQEPWPAFVFPGFKNVYETNGQYKIHETLFELYNEQNEKVASFKPHHLFSGIPRSQIRGLLRSLFDSKHTLQDFSPEAKDFLYQNSRKITSQEVARLDIVYKVEYLHSENNRVEVDSVDQQFKGMIYFSN